MRRPWSVFACIIIVCGLFGVSSVIGQVFEGRMEQEHASSLCEDCNAVSGLLEADLKILSKGDAHVAKEPLCTVNCFRSDPVCGCDGVTYWCGEAEAKCAQVEVAHQGYCDLWNGGVGANLGLHAAQSLQLLHVVWLVLACLLIVIGLP